MDHITGELRTMRGRLPSLADQQAMDAHLDGIRALEGRLSAGPSCEAGEAPQRLDHKNGENVPQISEANMALAFQALKCDLTRVMVLGYQVSKVEGRFLGLWRGTQHDNSHHHKGDFIRWNQWFWTEMMGLVDNLRDTPEGDGTMLDNTLFMWVTEMVKGNGHSQSMIPCFFVGGSNMNVKAQGRFINFGDFIPANDVWVSLCQMFGLPNTSFGDPEYCNGPRSELV